MWSCWHVLKKVRYGQHPKRPKNQRVNISKKCTSNISRGTASKLQPCRFAWQDVCLPKLIPRPCWEQLIDCEACQPQILPYHPILCKPRCYFCLGIFVVLVFTLWNRFNCILLLFWTELCVSKFALQADIFFSSTGCLGTIPGATGLRFGWFKNLLWGFWIC